MLRTPNWLAICWSGSVSAAAKLIDDVGPINLRLDTLDSWATISERSAPPISLPGLPSGTVLLNGKTAIALRSAVMIGAGRWVFHAAPASPSAAIMNTDATATMRRRLPRRARAARDQRVGAC